MPIISTIRAPTYRLSKYLSSLLEPCLGNSLHHVRNSEDVIHTQGSLWDQLNSIIVSYWYCQSVLTRVPTRHSLNLVSAVWWRQFYTVLPYPHFLLLFLWPVLWTGGQSFHGLTAVTCDCQLLHGGLWGGGTQQDSLQAHLLVLSCGSHSWSGLIDQKNWVIFLTTSWPPSLPRYWHIQNIRWLLENTRHLWHPQQMWEGLHWTNQVFIDSGIIGTSGFIIQTNQPWLSTA